MARVCTRWARVHDGIRYAAPAVPTSPQVPSGTTVEEDDAPRVVPAGTWASDGEEPAEPRSVPDESSDRLVRVSRPPPPSMESLRGIDVLATPSLGGLIAPLPRPSPVPSSATSSARMKSGTASASPVSAETTVQRPPFLASVLMRQRDEQHEPICVKRGRVLSVLGGGTACAAALGSGGVDLLTALLGALAAMLALSAFIPLPESRRSFLVVGLGLSTLVLGLLKRESSVDATALLGALAASAGLMLRDRRLSSWPAAALVALGAAGAVAWIVGSGFEGMIAASFEPSALARPAMGLGLVVLGALWMLAFVDDHGPSGAGYFASLTMGWAVLEALVLGWQAGAVTPSVAGAIAAAAALPATAIALAQTLGGRVSAPSRQHA